MVKLVNISTYFGSQANKQLMGVVHGTKYVKNTQRKKYLRVYIYMYLPVMSFPQIMHKNQWPSHSKKIVLTV